MNKADIKEISIKKDTQVGVDHQAALHLLQVATQVILPILHQMIKDKPKTQIINKNQEEIANKVRKIRIIIIKKVHKVIIIEIDKGTKTKSSKEDKEAVRKMILIEKNSPEKEEDIQVHQNHHNKKQIKRDNRTNLNKLKIPKNNHQAQN